VGEDNHAEREHRELSTCHAASLRVNVA
jgi:hypothetical protein